MPQVLVLKQCFLDEAKYLAGFAVQSIPAYSFTIFVSAIRHLRSPVIAGHSWTQQSQRHPFTHLLSLQGGGGRRFRPSTQRAKPWARGVANCRLRVASQMQWPQALVCEKRTLSKSRRFFLALLYHVYHHLGRCQTTPATTSTTISVSPPPTSLSSSDAAKALTSFATYCLPVTCRCAGRWLWGRMPRLESFLGCIGKVLLY